MNQMVFVAVSLLLLGIDNFIISHRYDMLIIPIIFSNLLNRCAVRGISSDKDFDKTIVDIAGTLTASSVALSHATVTARVLKSLITRDQTEMDFTSLSQVILEAVKLDSSGAISAEFQTVISNAIAINSGDDLPVDTGYSPEVAAFVEAVAGMGKACGMPGSWQGALLATLTSKTFVDGVRKNIVAGGCNCSRANIAGACFGALYGIGGEKGIPLEWIEKTDKGMEAFILAMKYVA